MSKADIQINIWSNSFPQETKVFNTVKEKIGNFTLFCSRYTLVTAKSIIATWFNLKYVCAFVEDQYIHLGEDKATSVSIRKRKMGKVNYTLLRNKYNVLSSGSNLPKDNYAFWFDAIKVVTLMQILRGKLQLKEGCLRNVTIAGHSFKIYLCMSAVASN